MPRQARLDAPGVLHHVMGRGIERGRIFWDVWDKEGFIRRLATGGRNRKVTGARAALAYAWVRDLGRSGHELAKALAVSPQSVYAASNRVVESNLIELEHVERWCN